MMRSAASRTPGNKSGSRNVVNLTSRNARTSSGFATPRAEQQLGDDRRNTRTRLERGNPVRVVLQKKPSFAHVVPVWGKARLLARDAGRSLTIALRQVEGVVVNNESMTNAERLANGEAVTRYEG